jgi:alpha-L-rhamnosidase
MRSGCLRAWSTLRHASLSTLTLSAAAVFAMCAGSARAADISQAATTLSGHAVRADPAWQAYDEAPARSLVKPVRVLDVTGQVTDAQALVHPGSGTTVFTYPAAGTSPSVVLDYGKDVGGLPRFDVQASSGAPLRATYAETLRNLSDDGAANSGFFGSGDGARTDLYTPTGPGLIKATVVQGGERYEEISLAKPGTLTLKGAEIEFTPLRETPPRMQGYFLSSDRLLNHIWYAGAYTLNLNELAPGTPLTGGQINQQHLLLDGAKRDRAVWSGDQLISDLTDFYVSDPRYARDSEALFLDHPASLATALGPAAGTLATPGPLPGVCSPNPLTQVLCRSWSVSYSIAVIPALAQYYLYTGDAPFVRAHWQAVVRQMAWDATLLDGRGLISTDPSDAIDWNIELPTGEVTYVNALYVEALHSAATLATALGQTAEAQAWTAAAANVSAAINRYLWDPGTGVYDASNTLRGPVVQDANVTAILAGVVPRARATGVLQVLARALATHFGPRSATTDATGYRQDISPYMGGFNVLADFTVGEQTTALSLIRQEWGYMISHDPGGVDWERIPLDGIQAGGTTSVSSAHAWSTGPTAALSRYVLGVAPVTPGYRTWRVTPEVGGLRFAQGVVPTPHGPISVRWQLGADDQSFVITVARPPGTTGGVAVPVFGRDRTIARDGHVVWSDGKPTAGVSAHRAGDTVVFSQSDRSDTYAWVS